MCSLNEPLSTTVPCFITVMDVPDLNPRFLGLPYNTRVEEGPSAVSAGGLNQMSASKNQCSFSKSEK